MAKHCSIPLLCCSGLSGDHTDDDLEALDHNKYEEVPRSSETSESYEEPLMRPSHVGLPPLSLSDAPGTTC